ncbi:hypothetical protein BGZ63DRAFT_236249 [Mariannaea sp. PMI_226]|nr:hypothetical protein BGZ63DRAFT_236249 [Mariannaea sp. PMI_226]
MRLKTPKCAYRRITCTHVGDYLQRTSWCRHVIPAYTVNRRWFFIFCQLISYWTQDARERRTPKKRHRRKSKISQTATLFTQVAFNDISLGSHMGDHLRISTFTTPPPRRHKKIVWSQLLLKKTQDYSMLIHHLRRQDKRKGKDFPQLFRLS